MNLNAAIGHWTTDPNGLNAHKQVVSASVKHAMQATLRDDARDLLSELELLEERLDGMRKMAAEATARCREIIAMGEFS
jgi:hypothetical protein